ncbi:MAG TPA: hypothetical protein VHY91_24280 [Pirellulales bacterium]|jgi:hypothetical protein|nr:hypothetical protein [Pirellulales bacterium]
MRRKLLTVALIALATTVVARSATAMWELDDKPVTPANAKANHFSVQVDNGDHEGAPVVHFKIVRTIDPKRDGYRDARLSLRKGGKLVFYGSLRVLPEKAEESWKFDVAPDSLAGSVLEVLVFDPSRTQGVTSRGIRYKFKLSDFALTGRPAN